jgi:hypothetical protein
MFCLLLLAIASRVYIVRLLSADGLSNPDNYGAYILRDKFRSKETSADRASIKDLKLSVEENQKSPKGRKSPERPNRLHENIEGNAMSSNNC